MWFQRIYFWRAKERRAFIFVSGLGAWSIRRFFFSFFFVFEIQQMFNWRVSAAAAFHSIFRFHSMAKIAESFLRLSFFRVAASYTSVLRAKEIIYTWNVCREHDTMRSDRDDDAVIEVSCKNFENILKWGVENELDEDKEMEREEQQQAIWMNQMWCLTGSRVKFKEAVFIWRGVDGADVGRSKFNWINCIWELIITCVCEELVCCAPIVMGCLSAWHFIRLLGHETRCQRQIG